MSSTQEFKNIPNQEKADNVTEEKKMTIIETTIETIVRDEVAVKRCCLTTKEDIHIACKCCAYTWCISLNGIECCCVSLSKMCIFLSDAALCCNKVLEEIDCDKH
jgi:hypothetical protein